MKPAPFGRGSLEAAGIERPILFGHSDGATIALLYAAANPSGARGVIAEAPHVSVEELALSGIARTARAFETTCSMRSLRFLEMH